MYILLQKKKTIKIMNQLLGKKYKTDSFVSTFSSIS